MTQSSFYSLEAQDAKKNTFSFEQLRGKVVLIVNVASKCGFTGQYEGLEKLYAQYKDQPFTIIGFPCNQFGNQEPGSEEEIQSFCRLTYGVSFPVMAKVEVNGDNEHPVYKWLKEQKSGILGLTRIKWNFEKFLINKDGEVVNRYSSMTKPEEIAKDVEKLL
ncbi:Glutathione peroxidase 2 [Sorochytrium milnesiophthora]